MLSFCFNPNGTMEERNGWQRVLLAARHFDVTVLCYSKFSTDELYQFLQKEAGDFSRQSLRFVKVKYGLLVGKLLDNELTFYLGHRLWHKQAFRQAEVLHRHQPFALSHAVTLCGFREPGYLWKLNVPHVWGPIGGTHNFPRDFLRSIDLRNRVRESIRSVMNYYQLHWCPRVHSSAKRSRIVIAATTNAKNDLERGFGIRVLQDLETGIDYPVALSHSPRIPGQPLRVLWSGRLRAWKGLPILIHALAGLKEKISIEVRILGDGSSLAGWKRLAMQLGVDHLITWIPWPNYRETLSYYEWADVFAFTSLRDTSGTGLLEALAAGTPIVTVDHQGAESIVTDACAIRVSTKTWDSTVAGFATGLETLANDENEWGRLSRGAIERAYDFQWINREEWMLAMYNQALQEEPRVVVGPMKKTSSLDHEIDSSVNLSLCDRAASTRTTQT